MATGTEASASVPSKQYRLNAEEELRVEVGWDQTCQLTLLSGTAEAYGYELAPAQKITLTTCKLAVFSWSGAILELAGTPEVAYAANETPMRTYINVHGVLEERRKAARAAPKDAPIQGPRVIVVGPTDAGKSSLCRMLCNWAVRREAVPTMVDLDIGQGSITIPATISATPVELPAHPVEGYPLDAPLVYYYGHADPNINPALYKTLVEQLAEVLEKRCADDQEARSSGFVVNTMGWIEGLGYELLLHAIEALKCDVVLVIGQERLYSQLLGTLTSNNPRKVSVVKLQRSGGVVTRDVRFRQQSRNARIREYFYGPKGDLCPHSTIISLSDVNLYRIGGGPSAPRSALPIGAAPTADPVRVVKAVPSRELLHCVLGVSHAEGADAVLKSNVAGFVYIADINLERQQMTVLAPAPGNLPSNTLIVGSLAWLE